MDLDVAGLGFCCLDDLLQLSEIPPPEGRGTILRRELHGGGMVATALVAVARLGGRAGLLVSVGDDAAGQHILDEFRRYGVDVSQSVVHPGATSHRTVVLVDSRSGSRAFLSDRGTVPDVQVSDVRRESVTGAKLLHLSDFGPAALQAARWAREAGRDVCFDGTHFHPGVWQLLPYVTYLIVSCFFAAEFMAHLQGGDVGNAARDFAALGLGGVAPASTGPAATRASSPDAAPVHHDHSTAPALAGRALLEVAERLRAEGPPVVVVTEGEHGCWCASAEGSFHVPAFGVTAVDTTGAGDVFHGAFLFGRARGWDIRRSLTVASAVAGLKCRALGGRAGIPTLEEALALVDGQGQRPS